MLVTPSFVNPSNLICTPNSYEATLKFIYVNISFEPMLTFFKGTHSIVGATIGYALVALGVKGIQWKEFGKIGNFYKNIG